MGRTTSDSVTLRQVAERAGVSIRTVSNVVTGAVPVRDATRIRVEQAVEELGYRPNVAARRLRSGRAQAIGLVLPDVTVPYFREFADDVFAAARAHGLAVVVEQTRGDLDRERSVLADPRLRHVDGIVFASVALDRDDLAAMPPPGRPVVLAGASAFDGPLDAVAPDQYAAGHAVGDLFGRTGRSRPVIVSADSQRSPLQASARYQGFIDGLADHGVDFGDTGGGQAVLRSAAVTLEAGRAAVPTVLDRWPGVDAIFANADALALGVLRGLHDAGRRVPEHVALVGFGNVEYAAHSHPTLTTVDTSRAAAAQAAVKLILQRRDAALPAAPQHLDIGFTLVERESTGAGG
ncbi:LacI family DNA-binding transcriptional regulator [Microlunatus endophyticus]|uniref:LacI family DNA-binding transcriptional regulator n=1 Tax=Microlunatus endophyticus TaxID=1716077 RepID=UPI001664AE5A|nr:LacI family DNA-binding transcriptional regulator [Microlunatus endophyticus]